MSATRFGEQTGIPYLRCGRTKAPHKGMKADFERSNNILVVKDAELEAMRDDSSIR